MSSLQDKDKMSLMNLETLQNVVSAKAFITMSRIVLTPGHHALDQKGDRPCHLDFGGVRLAMLGGLVEIFEVGLVFVRNFVYDNQNLEVKLKIISPCFLNPKIILTFWERPLGKLL